LYSQIITSIRSKLQCRHGYYSFNCSQNSQRWSRFSKFIRIRELWIELNRLELFLTILFS
jgi:hypothetical protein